MSADDAAGEAAARIPSRERLWVGTALRRAGRRPVAVGDVREVVGRRVHDHRAAVAGEQLRDRKAIGGEADEACAKAGIKAVADDLEF